MRIGLLWRSVKSSGTSFFNTAHTLLSRYSSSLMSFEDCMYVRPSACEIWHLDERGDGRDLPSALRKDDDELMPINNTSFCWSLWMYRYTRSNNCDVSCPEVQLCALLAWVTAALLVIPPCWLITSFSFGVGNLRCYKLCESLRR